MALSTYADLKDSIAGWLNRQDLTAQIPDFITLGEGMINSALRDRRMVTTVTAPVECGAITLPDDLLEAQDVRMVGAETPLRYIPLSEANPNRTALRFTGPRFYTLTGDTLRVLPAPDQNEDGTFPEVAVTYYARVPRLSTAQTTNWLLGAEPELYLYAALLKSAPYTVDDERLPIWASLYTDALNRLNISSKVALVSGGPLVRGRRGFG